MTPNLSRPSVVMCNMENVAIPRPPALPNGPLVQNIAPLQLPKPKINSRRAGKPSNPSQGFRLLDQTCANNDDTGSVCSIYKQKIDAMFESDSSIGKNSVQAKIEMMFSDVANDNGIPMNDIGVHTFSVDYLGSVPLQDKVTSLSGLQDPLKNLYFTYKKVLGSKKSLCGRLEISSLGLKVQHQGTKGDVEQLNSFPTIAVWSAVKFIVHDQPNPSYAFLPLITDPDNMDKQTLFRSLEEDEKEYILSESHHSPLFAVVMRTIGANKLECHGFVCQTSEDAIVIAATLYKSLVAHMKAKEKRPRNKNGVTTCMSVTSSLNNDTKNNNSVPIRPPRKKRSTASSIVSETDLISVSDTKPLLGPSSKPAKKSTKSKKAPKAPKIPPKREDLDAITPYEEPVTLSLSEHNEPSKHNQNEIKEIKPRKFSDQISTYMTKEQKQLTAEIKQMVSEGGSKYLKRVQNLRKSEENLIKSDNSGDILTKVTIPRSGSFLNAGGLTRYKNKGTRSSDQAGGGSPLGFKEIFNELSLQEGLHSLDDILNVIIDPEGMSFNDLKPIYKEFLLKLSLTLTKDELFQRSRIIMRRQKKKVLNRSGNQSKSRHHSLVGGKFRRLKHIFQKSLKRKLGKKFKKVKRDGPVAEKVDSKLPESSISTSSYDTRQFRPKEEFNKKQPYKKKSNEFKHRRDRISTSEESDFFSLKKHARSKSQFALLQNQNRNSSSGYVSCSECSYDSDTCTCVSADKCYCSLGQRNFGKNLKTNPTCYCPQDVSFCECDTDSCAESNKCYCQTFTSSQGKSNEHKHRKICKVNSNSKSTRSLEYILNPTENYYQKLKNKSKFGTRNSMPILSERTLVEYDRMSLAHCSLKDIPRGEVYSRNGYQGGFMDPSAFIRSRNQAAVGKALKSTGACSEALSVKKSAEIAALFADVKLSQTTDITHLLPNSYPDYYHKLAPDLPKNGKKGWHHHQKNSSALYRNMKQDVNGNWGNMNMYSAKNGLYTIQSQSDESSVNEGRRVVEKRDYFDLEQHRNNIEDSLGWCYNFNLSPMERTKWYDRLFGKKLIRCGSISNSGLETVATQEVLQDVDVTGVYFSFANINQQSDELIKKLREFYERFKRENGNKFEVVQVVMWAHNDNYGDFEGSHRESLVGLPWFAMPFSEIDPKTRLSRRYRIKSGVPTLVLLSKEGTTVSVSAQERLLEDPSGIYFPWRPRPIDQVLKDVVLQPGDAYYVEHKDLSKEDRRYSDLPDGIKGFYFSAHWCPPCRAFTPQLIEAYKLIRKREPNFEIIFVSSDRSAESYRTYVETMPWLSVPFQQTAIRTELAELYGIRGIPTLLLLDNNGHVITMDARTELAEDPSAQYFPWKPRPVNVLTERHLTKVYDFPAIVLFVDNEDTEIQFAESVLTPAADHYFKTHNINFTSAQEQLFLNCEEDPHLQFLIGADGETADVLRDLVGLDDVVPLLIAMDLPNRRYAVMEYGVEITVDTVNDFVMSLLRGDLSFVAITDEAVEKNC